jgi:hypothetical protein
MKLFKCGRCGQPVYFENYYCVHCNASLGFDSQNMTMLSMQEEVDNSYTLINGHANTNFTAARYKYCINKQSGVCNWILSWDDEARYCFACNLNRTIPNLGQVDHREKWARIEVAKHRLIYSLLRLKLPVISKFQDEVHGIAFEFKAENKRLAEPLITGHDKGVITLNIDEADDAIREMVRNQMDEVYRTLLGHFRHEIGHYYWDRLIKETNRLQEFRSLFGDERIDYGEALKKHYSQVNSDNWKQAFISAYASSHPWEDWAESWAHYMHIVDTLETAYSFGITIHPRTTEPGSEMSASLDIDPYTTQFFKEIIDRWIPLSFAMNSLNRSMGMKDSYPFVINQSAKEKLNFIHEVIRRAENKSY